MRHVVTKLTHDCQLQEKIIVNDILKAIIIPLVDKLIKKPCQELVKPLGDVVPEAFKDIMDPVSLLEDVIGDIVSSGIDAISSTAFAPEVDKIHAGSESVLASLPGAAF